MITIGKVLSLYLPFEKFRSKHLRKIQQLLNKYNLYKPDTMSHASSAPQYTIRDNIRHVEPYYQTITTTAKTRWLKRTVLDVLASEFRSVDAAEYKKRMENEEISVIHQIKLTKKQRKEMKANGSYTKESNKRKIVYPEILTHKLADNDVIQRIEHIHERDVIGVHREDIEVIQEDDDILVVNKPSGIPIHPVQNYFYNSFAKVLELDGWPGRDPQREVQLRPCYRLDKLTSGVCILAKSSEVASKIQTDIQNRNVEKVYLARVRGKFPGYENLREDPKATLGPVIACNDDVIIIDTKKGKKDGIMRKSAETLFQCVRYNAELDESIVMCFPKTGRTHQIRIHLRNLAHPIVNDPLYGKGQIMASRVIEDFQTLTDDYFHQVEQEAARKRMELESETECSICDAKLYIQDKASSMVMYLHAFKYNLKGESGWCFETKWPDWADI
jgi:RluA family pseudouridine synthase